MIPDVVDGALQIHAGEKFIGRMGSVRAVKFGERVFGGLLGEEELKSFQEVGKPVNAANDF